jgi:tRNA (adenine37-N6)-methyltransferase
MPSYVFDPIGVVRSPFVERADAPRQAAVARDVSATIELLHGHGYDHALEGLDAWEYAWIFFVFHKNVEETRGWKAKVLPPRSATKRGVFATRSPHRPNPIGLSAVKIERVDGLLVHVRGIDVLDGTPVLDLKPYVAYADAYPNARAGWLEASRDPLPEWQVDFDETARAQIDWLRARGVDLRPAIEAALVLGPQPHPYRRIKPHGGGLRLSLKEWRVDFEVDGQRVLVRALGTGYRRAQLDSEPTLDLHRDFAAVWH